MTLNQEIILKQLKTVQDPELKRDIVSLGMVKETTVDGNQVFVHLEVTSPKQDVRKKIQETVKETIQNLGKNLQVTVQLSKPPQQGGTFSHQIPVRGIKHIVAVASGKGGVGKTTTAVNLTLALKAKGFKVGLMDADIYGPNVPLMLGVSPDIRPDVNGEEKIIPVEAWGIKMISMGVLVPADQPMVWRGPMLHSAITQFFQKVAWGELDYLVIDLPPGTGDVQLTLVQNAPLTGAVIVTTPQEVSLMDVRKAIAMFHKTNVPILGIIENMSGEIFGRGGGASAAGQYHVPLLGEVPLDPKIRVGGDAGKPVVGENADSDAARVFLKAAEILSNQISQFAESSSR